MLTYHFVRKGLLRKGLYTLLLVGCAAHGHAAQSVVVSATAITDETPVAGTVAGTDTAEARARIGGTVTRVLAVRGQVVKKGQVVAVITDTKLPGQVQAVMQQRVAAEAQVQLAETNLKRMRDLLPLDAASPLQVEQAEAQLKAAQAGLAAVVTQASGVEGASADGRVVAPLSGVLSIMRVVTGSIVMPGEPVLTVDMKPLVVRFSVPQRHADALQVGGEVTLEGGAEPRMGTISRIYPAIENGRFQVDVQAEGLESVKVGSKLTARVATGTHTGILVPQAALFNRNGLSFATLKSGTQVVVQPGRPRLDGTVEILSGLNVGDSIVLP